MVKTFGAFAVEMLHFLEIVMPAVMPARESRMALRTMRLRLSKNLPGYKYRREG